MAFQFGPFSSFYNNRAWNFLLWGYLFLDHGAHIKPLGSSLNQSLDLEEAYDMFLKIIIMAKTILLSSKLS